MDASLISTKYIMRIADPETTIETVGGKGASLARLVAAGLPVPDGFYVTTAAYQQIVAENELQPQILAALEGVDISQPSTLEEASQAIKNLFAQAQFPESVAGAIAQAYMRLPGKDPFVAVRSSATAEDLPDLSFAGQQDTYLNIHGIELVLSAVKRCWASLWTPRAIGYRVRNNIDQDTVSLAVVVQLLVPADAAGILFTAHPVTGRRDQAMISAAWGLGEAVVGGLVTPDMLVVDKTTGRVLETEISDKQVMTVRVADRTEEHPVPDQLRHAPVLSIQQAAELVRLGVQIEELYQCPQDIEWAIADGKLYLLQSRAITTLTKQEPDAGEWNSTFTGDYLWTNNIIGEVFPTATTPSTWSVWQDYFSMLSMGNFPTIERIAGRPYLNYSLMYSFMIKVMRKHERVMSISQDSVGIPPPGVEVPPFPISWRTVLLQVIPNEARNELKKGRLRKNAHEVLDRVQQRCLEFEQQIKSESRDDLIALWTNEIRPLWIKIHPLQDKMNEELNLRTRKLKAELTKLLGNDEANTVLTTISSAGELASLGPLMGLVRLRSGELTRENYLKLYGHRGPQENEIAEPRPAEDPDWLDSQLAEFARSPVDVTALLEKRDAEFEAMRERIAQKLPPKQARDIERIIDETMETISLREETRSELTRLVGVIRELFLRAGELIGFGEGVFFLTVDEVLDALSGDNSVAENIPHRREVYERYRALPHLPTWIRGRFDPFLWAADPNRRQDVFDPQAPIAPPVLGDESVIKGHPGSAGLVEGIVQRIDSPEEGNLLQPGEILVTSTTNVGWTPLFTRAAAVITDIGGSLSHAAIVARELGIPAVVGCGNATTLLHTGDRVRVDGERGTVEIKEMTRAPNLDESATR